MFEEQIAHGKDMISRLEPEIGLSYQQRDGRPAYQRVPMTEWSAWIDAVGKGVRSSFGPETVARYDLIWKLFSEEAALISKKQSDEVSCALNALRRVVALLSELDHRKAPTRAESTLPAPPPAKLEPEAGETSYDVFISHA